MSDPAGTTPRQARGTDVAYPMRPQNCAGGLDEVARAVVVHARMISVGGCSRGLEPESVQSQVLTHEDQVRVLAHHGAVQRVQRLPPTCQPVPSGDRGEVVPGTDHVARPLDVRQRDDRPCAVDAGWSTGRPHGRTRRPCGPTGRPCVSTGRPRGPTARPCGTTGRPCVTTGERQLRPRRCRRGAAWPSRPAMPPSPGPPARAVPRRSAVSGWRGRHAKRRRCPRTPSTLTP